MVPIEPEVSQWRGERKSKYCAAHIWCWPTPVLMIARPSVWRLIASHHGVGLDQWAVAVVVHRVHALQFGHVRMPVVQRRRRPWAWP